MDVTLTMWVYAGSRGDGEINEREYRERSNSFIIVQQSSLRHREMSIVFFWCQYLLAR
jgi:hypothetical protein